MFLLPEQAEMIEPGLEKIDTYLTLSKIGCPVFKSVVIMPDEKIDLKAINRLYDYFKTDEVTIRYQYIRPSINPIQGGNRYKLSQAEIASLQNRDTLLWMLEPINRLKNEYGINLYFHYDNCSIELVGKGFDVSDLNRGQISPHQVISTGLPIRMGEYNEWWKFLKYSFATQAEYELSQIRRIQKLSKMGYIVSDNIFNKKYQPLSMEKLEELLIYVSLIYAHVEMEDYCVSCSISDNHYIFWDIQTPNGKKHTYGVK